MPSSTYANQPEYIKCGEINIGFADLLQLTETQLRVVEGVRGWGGGWTSGHMDLPFAVFLYLSFLDSIVFSLSALFLSPLCHSPTSSICF